jgi:hypothetical protein
MESFQNFLLTVLRASAFQRCHSLFELVRDVDAVPYQGRSNDQLARVALVEQHADGLYVLLAAFEQ